MTHAATPRCTACQTKDCRSGQDCFDNAEMVRGLYEDRQVARLHKAATAIEGRHYCREPRIREIMLFAQELGLRKLGLAFCTGLANDIHYFTYGTAGGYHIFNDQDFLTLR